MKFNLSFVSYSGQDPEIDELSYPIEASDLEEAQKKAEEERRAVGAFSVHVKQEEKE